MQKGDVVKLKDFYIRNPDVLREESLKKSKQYNTGYFRHLHNRKNHFEIVSFMFNHVEIKFGSDRLVLPSEALELVHSAPKNIHDSLL